MKKVIFLLLSFLTSFCSFAQNDRYLEVDDIRYRVLTEADGASTFGTVSVAKSEFGGYEGDIVIPNVVKESKDTYADSYKVINIDDQAFAGAKHLNSATLPPSIEKMGDEVFLNSSLESVTIPVGNLTELGAKAFWGCTKLKEISIPSTVKTIGQYAFYSCVELSKVTLNEGLENIEEGAFDWCYGLNTIEIPNTVRNINDNAFGFCYRLSSISIGAGVKRIGKYCFEHCIRLRCISLPNGLREIGEGAFQCTGITEIKIPEKIHEISTGCFQASKIRKVTLPSQLDKVYLFAFANCNMDNIDVPKEKQEIESNSYTGEEFTPFVGTLFDTDKGQKEREDFVKKNSSKLVKISFDYNKMDIRMANDKWAEVKYNIDNIVYSPIIHPTSKEKYGLLKVVEKPNGVTLPDIITITNGPYQEQYIVNGGNVLPYYKEK